MSKFFETEQEEKNTYISHSQFKTYRQCPRKWQLKYRDGKRPPDESIHLIFGVAIHEAVQLYLRVLYNSTVKEANSLNLKDRFRELLKEEYDNRKESFNKKHPDTEFPVTKQEMVEFAKDGAAIIEYFKRNRSDYFSKRETKLVGIEEKIDRKVSEGIHWIGYLDVVLYNKSEGTYKIIDLKSSTKGWNKWKKREKKRTDQLVAYKMFYADQLGVDPEQIEVEYLIMKRKLNEDAPYNPPRFQQFSPASGSQSRNRVEKKIQEFISDGFEDGGDYKNGDFEKDPGKYKCVWCPFSKQFGDEGYQICDQGGNTYLDYGEGMAPYVDDKYVGPQPE